MSRVKPPNLKFPRHDMTPLVDGASERGTGPVRTRRPRYVELLPPCNHACPAGENIQGWLALAQGGAYREAWELLVRDNPLPATHGRVCYHPCESACNRGELDAAVRIHAVERFLGDQALQQGWPLKLDVAPSGRRVLIVGAGPSGLSAAYHLARQGHQVEVRDAAPLPGGMMQYGIPAYRLPRQELAREISRIEAMGVRFVMNHATRDVLAERDEGRFDAVFLAIGAGAGKHVEIPVHDAAPLLDAVALLHQVSSGDAPLLGRRVLVYGGGDTAADAARTARRLGAEETLIVYRRDRSHMPAHAFELNAAIKEGVKLKWLSTITEVSGSQVRIERMVLDERGRPQPTGQFETLTADAVVLAVGQDPQSAFLREVPGIVLAGDGSLEVGNDLMSGAAGIFAGGDMLRGERSVTVAVGHGKRAARHIGAWLRGESLAAKEARSPVSFPMLHLPLYNEAPPAPEHSLPRATRLAGFDEIVEGLNEAKARHEAQRCLSCGNCVECDACFAACPERAIAKLGVGQGYAIDAARCTGCAVCFEHCPCHAIEMVPESASHG